MMSWLPKWAVAAALLFVSAPAWALCSKTPNTFPYVDGCPLSASSLNSDLQNASRLSTGSIDASLLTGSAMALNGANATLPDAINYLLANRYGQVFYAPFYRGTVSGALCTWDDTHDVGDCVNAAIAAAYNGGNVLGKVVIPAGTLGLSTTISQKNKNGVVIEGAGAPGWYGVCNTRLKWIGAVGGTMIEIGPATQNVLNASVNGICVDGNLATAATGIKVRGLSDAIFRDTIVLDVSGVAWDVDSNAATNGGTHDVWFWETGASLTTAGAINATGWKIGRGSAAFSTDTFRVHWLGGFVQYQNGTGFECGGMDSAEVLGMDIQPAGGGTGTSLHLLGDPTGLMCRSNRFITTGGFGRTTATRPVADTDTIPSQNNYIYQNHESQSSDNTPLINGAATLTWDDNQGAHFSNVTTSNITTGGTVDGKSGVKTNGVAVVPSNVVHSQPGNPTGTTTTANFVLMGGGITFAPTAVVGSGKFHLEEKGVMNNGTVNDGVNVAIFYGTGSAPANGTNGTGTCGTTSCTQCSVVQGIDKEPIAGMWVPFVVSCDLTGLTLGTTYWAQISAKAVTGGTATPFNLDYRANEQ